MGKVQSKDGKESKDHKEIKDGKEKKESNKNTYSYLQFHDGNSVLGDRGRWPKKTLRMSQVEDMEPTNDPDRPRLPRKKASEEWVPMVSAVKLIDTTSIITRTSSSTTVEGDPVPHSDTVRERAPLLAKKSKSAPALTTGLIRIQDELDFNLNKVEPDPKPEVKIVVQEVDKLETKKPQNNLSANSDQPKPLRPILNSKYIPPKEPTAETRTTPSVTSSWVSSRPSKSDYSKIPSSRNISQGEIGGGKSSEGSKKKLIVRGLKSFVSSRGCSSPPAWVRDFPCKSRFHPDNYIYDWEQGAGAKIPSKSSGGIGSIGAMGAGGNNCSKKSARCGTCGIYSEDACRCCRKCPLDCPCPKPPTKIPDVMSTAFGPGWSQAQKVICEMTESERKHPVGGNASKMNKGLLQHGDYPPRHLQCNIDILNPDRVSYGGDPSRFGTSMGQPQPSYQNQGPNYYPSPPIPYNFYPQAIPQQMYPSYYPPPSYMPMQNPMSYSQPSYQNYPMMSPYPSEYPQNY